MPIVMEKSKSKKAALVSEKFALFNWSSVEISDLPFVKNKEYQYKIKHILLCINKGIGYKL